MAQTKFTRQQVDRFNDKIENCLDNQECRKLLNEYLKRNKRLPLAKTLKLWEAANITTTFDNDMFMDLIEEIADFNQGPLLTMDENSQKFTYIKSECSRILDKILPLFIDYLRHNHMSGS